MGSLLVPILVLSTSARWYGEHSKRLEKAEYLLSTGVLRGSLHPGWTLSDRRRRSVGVCKASLPLSVVSRWQQPQALPGVGAQSCGVCTEGNLRAPSFRVDSQCRLTRLHWQPLFGASRVDWSCLSEIGHLRHISF